MKLLLPALPVSSLPSIASTPPVPRVSAAGVRALVHGAVLGVMLAGASQGWAAGQMAPQMEQQKAQQKAQQTEQQKAQPMAWWAETVYLDPVVHVAHAPSGEARSRQHERRARKILLARSDPSGQTHPFGASGQHGQPGSARALSHRHSLPVWELGLGASAITLPDYRGSDRQRQYLLPLPLFVYRSPHLRVDRGGIRADLWDSDRYELDVSVGATPPVRRTTTGIRAGMPRLKPLFEIGPRLQVHLWSDARARQQLRLELPLRYAMPFGRLQNRGWVFSPNLTWQVDDVAGFSGWRLALWGGPVFSTRAWHRYYYQVEPQYARPGRPAYSPKGGYSGLDMTVSLNRRYPQAWVAGFVRASHLGGAAIADSPLVRRRTNVSAGLVVGWLFARSQEEVRQAE